MAVYQLSVDGTPLPRPKQGGVVVSEEKIWSANTGRVASGRMQGTLIGIKTTVQISWGRLTPGEAELIRAAVSNPATPFSVLRYGAVDGTVKMLTGYFGAPVFTIHRYTGIITGASVSFIEQ